MGVAENTLMYKEQKAFYNSKFSLDDVDFTYGTDLSGSVRLGKALSSFVNNPNGAFKPLKPIEPDHIVFGAGVSAVLDMTALQIGDPGDGVLIQAPLYAGFNSDLNQRASLKTVPVFVDENDRFGPATLDIFEAGLQKSESEGTKIRAVILCNPHNPIGQCYPRETILAYARFCQKHDLHLISDEVYAYSVFPTADNPSPEPFVSVFSIDFEKEAQCDPARVHVLYGASKDFCCNGFRAAALISHYNPDILTAVRNTSLFMKIASPSLNLWSSILEDTEFFKAFQKENVRRLQASYTYVTEWLKFHGIPYVPSNAGHFLMADFRKFFGDKNLAGKSLPSTEEDLGKARDMALFEVFLSKKIYVGTSTAFTNPVPGWYRVTFATRKDFLVVGLARLEDALGLEHWPKLGDLTPHESSLDADLSKGVVNDVEEGLRKTTL